MTAVPAPRPGPPLRTLLAGVVGGALVAGLVVGQLDDGDARPVAPAAPAAPAAVGPVPAVPLEPAMTSPTDGETVPTFAPAGVRWTLVRGYALPAHPQAGPVRVDGAVAEGYARTPVGALLAAVNIDARKLLAGADWRQVTERQVLPGPGRDEWMRQRSQLPADAPAGELAQVAGFRFLSFTPDVAVVEVAGRSKGGLQVGTATVRWAGGDWRLEIPRGGAQSRPVASLVGLTPWSGVA